MSNLSPWEIEKYSDITRALSDDQRKIVLANLRTTELYEELDRRTKVASEKLAELDRVVSNNAQSEMTLLDMQNYFKELKEVLL